MHENRDDLLPVSLKDYETLLEENRENGWRSIPPQTKILVHKYAESGNIKKATKEAGISLERGVRILRDRLVDEYFHSIVDDLVDISILNRQFLEQEYLTTLAQLDGQEDIVKMNRDGDVVVGRHFDGSAKVSLLKDMRGFVGVKDIGSGGGVNINIDLGAFTGRDEKEVAPQPALEVSLGD